VASFRLFKPVRSEPLHDNNRKFLHIPFANKGIDVLKVLFYVNILQCFFVVENVTANAVSVAIGDNGNRLIFEIWWNFFYNLFSIKNVADVNSIDSFVSKLNMRAKQPLLFLLNAVFLVEKQQIPVV
jgi:hypothetical protein